LTLGEEWLKICMDRTYKLNNNEIGENAIYYKCLVTGY
jgi:hypothetical protein